MQDVLNVVWVLLLLQLFMPALQRQLLAVQRQRAIRAFERARHSRVITLIHRQETMSVLGIPIARYIDIEDSEQVLRAIRMTAADMPIDIVLHTPGGIELAAEQVAWALVRHPGRVTAFVPHYAMSGGTLVALAADEIVMDPNAVLGPVDPVLATAAGGGYPAASILAAIAEPNANRSDETLILGDTARKAAVQVRDAVQGLLATSMRQDAAERTACALTDGRWTHDFGIDPDRARSLGLAVSVPMPDAVHELMELYPQATRQRTGVEYVPIPYRPAPSPAQGRRARG